jgi:hypothetical protein
MTVFWEFLVVALAVGAAIAYWWFSRKRANPMLEDKRIDPEDRWHLHT